VGRKRLLLAKSEIFMELYNPKVNQTEIKNVTHKLTAKR
jgi:hypothetical protein